MDKGKVIVIEGASDGIGKSTQIELIKQKFNENNIEYITHHFPSYGTFHGALVEKYLSGEFGDMNNLTPYFINGLYALDRASAWNLSLKKQYEDGKVLLFDRYTTSSLIYQTTLIEGIEEKKQFIDYVCDYEYNKLGLKKPDIVIFLTAQFDLITQMRQNRKNNDGIQNDIHERNIDYMKKAYDNAQFVAKYLNWDIIECSDNDKMLPREEIHQKIYQRILRK